jgi:CRP-like cAMP-binding protein
MSDPLFARYGKELAAGDVLFREGEPGEVMYVIQSGAVRITKRVSGEDKTLATLGPGEFVGEMAILNTKPRTATAVVIEGPTRCLLIDSKTLESMVSKSAEIAMRLIRKLAKRLDSADALIEILMHRDAKARVLLALARHAGAFGEQRPEGIFVRTSAPEVASEVGVPLDVAIDLFSRLKRLHLIEELGSGGWLVADLGRLHDFIDFLEMPSRFGGAPSG